MINELPHNLILPRPMVRRLFAVVATLVVSNNVFHQSIASAADTDKSIGGAQATDENYIFPANIVQNVKEEFGAKGDGKTDDTAALQAAFDKYRGKNRTIYFPNGTYLITGSVGIFNGKAHSQDRFIGLQGQSEKGVIIRWKENSEGFDKADKPKNVISTYRGEGTGDVMQTYVRDLTVEVGPGNPGAAGLRYMSNNVGAMNHVTIRSTDPKKAGAIGLDLSQGQNGPCYIKNVTVDGFDKGVATGNTFSLVLEHITLRNQRVVGYENNSARTTLRDLRSENKVPAATNGEHGELTLVDSNFTGGSAEHSAIVSKGSKVFVRNITQSGYKHAITDSNGKTVDGENVEQWHGLTAYAPFGAPEKTLGLPIEETPDVPWETDLTKWIIVDNTNGPDITEQLQKAFDDSVSTGATTLCIKHWNKYSIKAPIRVHGNINRVIGIGSVLNIVDPNGVFKGGKSVFTIEDLKSDAIVFERFFSIGGWDAPKYANVLENKSGKTIILKDMGVQAHTKLPDPGGRWFLENVVPSRTSTFEVGKDEKVWIRQWNPESPEAVMTHVDGGQLWVLGLKTEGRATQVSAENGAKVEVLGGVVYQSWKNQKLDPPAFVVKDSQASFTVGFYHYKDPFTTIVSETTNGQTKTLDRKDIKGYFMPLYRSGK